MRKKSDRVRLYGFEDYEVRGVPYEYFIANSDNSYYRRCYIPSNGYYLINDNLPVTVNPSFYERAEFPLGLYTDHKELLTTAKKVYVHPSCKLSRSMMAEKYKKSLSPWMADVVVLPEAFPNLDMERTALFINEEKKKIVRVDIGEKQEVMDVFNNCTMGTKLRDIADGGIGNWISNHFGLIREDILNSELTFVGYVLYIAPNYEYALDILTRNIPLDKTVSEESMQNSLGDKNNEITFEALVSIYDMLESDEDTVAAGLKALSMLDWMHWPNSVKYMFAQIGASWKVRYNKAFHSTSVKYMIRSLYNNVRSFGWSGYGSDISQQDYELFRKLIAYFEKIEDKEVNDRIKRFSFMHISPEGMLVPNIKQPA